MKNIILFALLFLLSITLGVNAQQYDSVYYQGPSQGSVASGTMVNIDNFFNLKVESGEPREIIKPELLVTENINPLNLDNSNSPPSYYSEDKSVSKEQNVAGGETVLLNGWQTDVLNSYIPPDPDVAVGPNHIITTVNVDFSIWDKEGNLINNINGDTWCSQVIGAPSAFDPQVIYDHYDNRWFILWDTRPETTQSSFVIAYSDDSDPNGIWYMYAINASMNGSNSTNFWADFPHVGFDDEAIYITSNQFQIGNPSNQHPRIRIISKSELYSSNGGSLTWRDIWNIKKPGGGVNGQPQLSMQPAISYSTTDDAYFAWAAWFNANYYSIFKIENPLTNPWLRGKAITQNVPFYYAPQKASQLGGGTLIENDGGFKNRVVVRNGLLYAAHAIGNSSNPTVYSSIKYAVVNLSNMTIFEQSEFGAVGYYYMYPQLTVDKDSNIAVTFSRSADTEYIGGYYATKYNGDPPGLNESYPLALGNGNYIVDFGSGRNRWGDYLGIYLDPANEQDIWIFPEYAAATNVWGTYIGQIRMVPFQGAHAYAESFVVDFGDLELGSTPSTLSIALSNYGSEDLTVSSVNTPTGPFTLLTGVPFTLAPFDSIELEFEFDPTDAVVYDELMSFTNNDPDFAGFTMKGRGYEINETSTNVFYAISNATVPDTGTTISLNKTTGVGSELGKSNFSDIRALTIDPETNIMYGIIPGGTSSALVRVNATGGDAYPLYTLSGVGFAVGVAFDTVGTLYAATQGGQIYKVDLSNGTTTLETTTASQLTAIAFDPLTNDLWATPRLLVGQKDKIFKIDLSTGDTTNVGRTGFNVQTNDLAFDETGVLYGVIGGTTEIGKLISIDKIAAVGTEIGETGYTSVQSLAYRNSNITFVTVEENIPEAYSLKQNYPNPFNPTTRIEFSLPVASAVELSVFNILGQQVAKLINEERSAGNHSIIWNANDSNGMKLSSGIYFYKLKASGTDGNEFQQIRKMVLLK